MARTDSLAKLAFAYGVHLARRRLRRPRSQLSALLATYAPDGIRELEPSERERHPDQGARFTLTGPRGRRRRRRGSRGARVQPGRGLRVIHIMYTVWGDHTTYRVNGQEVISTAQALDGGGKLPLACPAVHGGGL